MKAKYIFIILVTVLLTVILMKNTDEVVFWVFGEVRVSKLAVMGTMFGLGLLTGLLLRRSRKTIMEDELPATQRKGLSEEDEEYIN